MDSKFTSSYGLFVASPSKMKNTGRPNTTGMSTQVTYESVSPAVTPEEQIEREHELQSLKFHISTLVILLLTFLHSQSVNNGQACEQKPDRLQKCMYQIYFGWMMLKLARAVSFSF